MSMFLLSAVAFLFAIGVLVAVHEWGHYIVARMAGVKVLRFSIGFGKPLWSRVGGPDQTEYCLSAIPLGGYVKLLDGRESEVPPAEAHRAFDRIPVIKRIAILVAGPAMNFIFAIAAYWVMYSVGVPGMQPILGDITAESPAAVAGLQSEDRITAVGEDVVSTWEGAVLAILDEMLDQELIELTVVGADEQPRQVVLDVTGKVEQLTEPGKLFTGLGMQPWTPVLQPVMGEIVADGAALEAGFETGDLIIAVDGEPIASWSDWVMFVRENPGRETLVLLERDGQRQERPLNIGVVTLDDGSQIGRIGAGPEVPEGFYDSYVAQQKYSPLSAFWVGVERTWSMSMLTVRMMSRIVTGDVSVKNISGPINIAQYAGYSASVGLSSFLNFLAVVSLSLGIINLLPIPILDGGQVLYQLAEAIKGQPLSAKAQLIGQQIGLVLLVLVMGFAFYNDLSRVFS